MIDGITILNENTIDELNVGVFFAIILLVLMASLILSILFRNELVFLALSIVGILFLALPMGLSTGEEYVQYECIIDDSVPMVEVYEKYEVIEQRGDIWVLEDKE